MSTLQQDHCATPQQQAETFVDNCERRKYTTEAEALLDLLRRERDRGFSVDQCSIWQLTGIHEFDLNKRFRELRGQGFKIRYRLEWLDDEVELSYDLVFDPERDAEC
jgi:hypothetical protein